MRASAQPLDVESSETQRLAADGQAMDAMRVLSAQQTVVEEKAPGSAAGAWKWVIRKRMWDYMEANDIARFPRPVHHRIPNFVDAELAAARLAALPEFIAASVVKVNPDTPQKMVRFAVLKSGKTLLTPQPRLRTGFFSTIHRDRLPDQGASMMEACSSAGGCENGARLGKGEGFAELEYGMLRWMGAVDENTLVVTTVHDCQVLEPGEIDPAKMLEHDVPVDVIVTPTRVIYTNTTIPKPPGILWHVLSPEKLSQIRVLQQLKARIEATTGEKLPTGPSESLPPLAERNSRSGGGRGSGGRGRGGGRSGSSGGGRGRSDGGGGSQGDRNQSSVQRSGEQGRTGAPQQQPQQQRQAGFPQKTSGAQQQQQGGHTRGEGGGQAPRGGKQ
ncbi:MAG: hypothetical protein WDW38_001199 [Sanguina aurantia]